MHDVYERHNVDVHWRSCHCVGRSTLQFTSAYGSQGDFDHWMQSKKVRNLKIELVNKNSRISMAVYFV